jgi:hypothetical protein
MPLPKLYPVLGEVVAPGTSAHHHKLEKTVEAPNLCRYAQISK